jgi:hypothetical protein
VVLDGDKPRLAEAVLQVVLLGAVDARDAQVEAGKGGDLGMGEDFAVERAVWGFMVRPPATPGGRNGVQERGAAC